jgi:hypothetical protein
MAATAQLSARRRRDRRPVSLASVVPRFGGDEPAGGNRLSLAVDPPGGRLLNHLAELAQLPSVVDQLRRQVEALRAEIDDSRARPSDLLDVNAAAKLLAITPKALRQAVFRGTIRPIRVGRRLRFRARDLLEHES